MQGSKERDLLISEKERLQRILPIKIEKLSEYVWEKEIKSSFVTEKDKDFKAGIGTELHRLSASTQIPHKNFLYKIVIKLTYRKNYPEEEAVLSPKRFHRYSLFIYKNKAESSKCLYEPSATRDESYTDLYKNLKRLFDAIWQKENGAEIISTEKITDSLRAFNDFLENL